MVGIRSALRPIYTVRLCSIRQGWAYGMTDHLGVVAFDLHEPIHVVKLVVGKVVPCKSALSGFRVRFRIRNSLDPLQDRDRSF